MCIRDRHYRQVSLSADPKFRLQVILENPQQGEYYTVTAETKETVYYVFSKPQEIGPQEASVDVYKRQPPLDLSGQPQYGGRLRGR